MNILFTSLISILFCAMPIFSVVSQFIKNKNSELNKNKSQKISYTISFFKANIFNILAIVILFFGCFIRIIFMHFHIIALKVKFSMRRKNSHAESIMEESYEGNRNCTSD